MDDLAVIRHNLLAGIAAISCKADPFGVEAIFG